MRYLPLLFITGLLMPVARAEGQDRYADPDGRFTLTIPPGWEASNPNADAVTVSNGPAQVTLMLPGQGEADALLEQFLGQYESQWTSWHEIKRDGATLGGSNGHSVFASGRNPRGIPSFIRIATARSSIGPVVLLSSAPQEGFSALRPTLEGIEGGIVLGGGRPRPAAPAPGPQAGGNSAAGGRAFLGVGTRAVEAGEVRQFGLRTTDGAVVGQLYPGGPAEEAGLSVGDVIVALDGATITSPRALNDAVARHHAGDAVVMSVIRQGRRGDLRVQLRAPPER